MIGVSMALTIAVGVAAFSVIYAALDDTVGDFVARDVPAPVIPTPAPTQPPAAGAGEADDEEAADDPAEEEAAPEPTTEPTAAPEPTEDADAFTPDYQSNLTETLNFRSAPSATGGPETIIQVLDTGTLLQSTGETQPSDRPQDGPDGWLQFTLEDGAVGWLRVLDIVEYTP